MATETEAEGRRLKSVGQAFKIIEFLRGEGPTTLSGIAERFDMPMSTAYIHLATLVESGYVIKEDGEYQCSLRFLHTGGELRNQMPLYQAAKTGVDDLREELGEIANVVTLQDGYAVQLYKSENPESIDDNAPLGEYFYAHSTATGKSMLSQLPQSDVDRIVERRGLAKSTAATITTRDELAAELAEIDERGYAINQGEHFPGVCAVGVPIMSKSDAVLGAISVSGPISRMNMDRISNEIAPELFNKKNIIELKLQQH